MIVYRGIIWKRNTLLFNGNLKNRISRYIHGGNGNSDSFYNWYMSNS